MNPASKFAHVYLIPLLILGGLFFALRWIPVQMALEWLVPLAADYVPASVPPLQIIMVIGLTVGGLFAMVILYMTRSLNRRVVYRQRLKVLEDKRKRGHDNIAASVFDLSAISLVEVDEEFQQNDLRCALEEDSRLSMLISTLWPKPEFYNFLNRLLKNDAGDGRILSPEMRHELAFLRNLYVDQIDVLGVEQHAVTEPVAGGAANERSDRARGFVAGLALVVLLLLPVA